MSDNKRLKWAEEFRREAETDASNDNVVADVPAANDADGWQQYRRWVSGAPAPKTRRSGIDPSLYTWKGYRNWTEQVRRNWNDEDGESGKD